MCRNHVFQVTKTRNFEKPKRKNHKTQPLTPKKKRKRTTTGLDIENGIVIIIRSNKRNFGVSTMVPAYGMVLGLPMATHIYTISTSLQDTFFHSEFICYNRPCNFILPQATGIIVTIVSK